jgi:cell division protein FtsZ
MKPTTKIKVVGVGGSGSNAVSRMTKCKIQGVDLIAINTDAQDLKNNQADFKLQIGKKITNGLGAGMNPKLGELAAKESQEEIKEIIKDAALVFVACGLGGGTGTGAAPVIAEIAKSSGALTIAVVTKPFSFEGIPRKNIAEKGLERLKERSDALVVIPNDRLLKMIDEKTPVFSAFWLCDEILREGVQGISDLVTIPGIVNVDFADLEAIMKNSGPALLGIGRGKGENRIAEAVNSALFSPLLENTHWKKGRSLLFNISSSDLTLFEVNQAANLITKNLSPKVKVIFGAVEDEKMEPGELKILVFVTGLRGN